MRHATSSQRLSRPSEHRGAILHGLVRGLILHGQITTTYARAKEAQRLADRLVTLGKGGSVHSRRRAFRVLQDRTLVKQLFADVAPRFVDVPGGYTRVIKTSFRRGDGAQQAVLAFSRLPAVQPAAPQPGSKPVQAPKAPTSPERAKSAKAAEAKKAKKSFFEGLRKFWGPKEKGSAASS